MTTLYANPYDITAQGFSFTSLEDYNRQAATLRNEDGYPVEEFEISFLDGETIDAELFRALSVHQGNFHAFLTICDDWDDHQKTIVIIAVGEVGYNFDPEKDSPEDFDIDIYQMDSMRELAEHYVEEGLFGDVPDNLRFYLDYDAIARDLEVEYSQTVIDGKKLIYRCS